MHTWRHLNARQPHSDNFTHPGALCFRRLWESTRASINCHIPSQLIGDWSALLCPVPQTNNCSKQQIICWCKVDRRSESLLNNARVWNKPKQSNSATRCFNAHYYRSKECTNNFFFYKNELIVLHMLYSAIIYEIYAYIILFAIFVQNKRCKAVTGR